MYVQRSLCAIAVAASVLAMPVIGHADNFGIGKVLGKTYGEWSAKWWQWAFDSNFAQFTAGDVDCSAGQKGAVWFLGGGRSPAIRKPGLASSASREEKSCFSLW
jgi:hypothetical protein